MANFDFTLPDGRVIRVEGAPSEEAARSFMDTQWDRLRRETPIEGFGESFGQQFRGQFGAVPGAAQAAAAAVGAPETAAALGRAREAVAPGDLQPATRAPELRDIVSNPIDALAAFAGQAAGAVVGGGATILAGAGLGAAGGAAFGGPGGAAAGAGIGARVGLLGGSVLGSVDELYQGLVAEGVDPQRAGRIAISAGSAIGAVEGAALLPMLRRITGGQLTDAAIDRIAGRIVGGRAGGIRQTAALGAGSEMAGETARQGVIAAETGNLDLAERASRVGEAGIVGGIAGGGVGAGVRIAGRAGPAPGETETPPAATIPQGAFEAAPTPEPTATPEEAAPSRPEPLTIPERPEPFTDVEEARSFLAANRGVAPTVMPTQPESILGAANNARIEAWNETVANTRATAIKDFFPTDPQTTAISPVEAINNIAAAANRGELGLRSFTPNEVARAALISRDLDPGRVTKNEIQEVTKQLNALADTGAIRQNTVEATTKKGKKVIKREPSYSINYGAATPAQPTPTPTPTPEAAATPTPVPPATQGAPVPQAAPTQAAPQAGQFTFKTSRGSTYTGFEDGTTTRDKAARPEHPGDFGPKPRSTRTIYVTPDVAQQMAIPADVNWRFVITGDNTFSLITQRPDGQWGVSPSQRDLPFQTQPAVGLNPFEFWRPETIRGLEGYRSFHPGNQITEISRVAPTPVRTVPGPAPASAAPAQPTARTTVEVDGVQRETTPETLQQTVDEMRAGQRSAEATPQEDQLAEATARLDPASGAGEKVRTAEEALLNTPKDMPLKDQRKILDKQFDDVFKTPAEGFRGGKLRKWFASTLTGIGRQPIYQAIADVGRRIIDRKYRATTDFAQLHEAMRNLPAESQARAMLTLQESSSRKKMWNRDVFTAEENRAMDDVVKMGQRGLDYIIDAYTTKYFNPANARTPEQRARLEAFQQAKGNRLITEIPATDLRAISEDGAKEVARLNARRNPFYLPQSATGSHFVAAYKRGPGGKKGELVRIYFYNPLKGAQKLRQRAGMQRDFEALSIQALRDEFPDTNKFLIMPRGIEATQDSQAGNLKKDGEFIARYLEELRKVGGSEARRIIARMSKEIDKAQMDRFFRPNNDKLRAVTPWNAVDFARETLPNYYLALSNIQARVAAQEDFVRAQDGFSREEKEYWDNWLNFNSTPVEALGAGRALAGAWFLGGNLSTAMIQLTQNPVLLPARFARDGAGAMGTRTYLSAARDVYGTATNLKAYGKELEYSKQVAKSKSLAADEVAAFERAIEEGVVKPSTIVNIRGQFDADDVRRFGLADQSAASFANGANRLLDLSFRFLSTADETNRAVAFLAAHRLAKARPQVMVQAGQLDGRTYANPYEYAKSVSEQTNFLGGPEDQNLISRFHPAAQVVTQFLSPSFKFLELFARSAASTVEGLRKSDPTMAKAGAVMFGTMMAAQIAFAGLWSLPFADRLKELVEFVLSKAFDIEVDFEQEIEKLPFGSLIAAAFNYGLPHALGVATLSERMKIDVLPQGSISDWDVFSLLGPVGGLIEKPMVALEAYDKNDYWGIAYALLPTALANVVKGTQIGVMGEQFTRAGGRIITPEQVERVAADSFVPPGVRQAIGFAPTEFTDIRRAARRQQEMADPLRRDTERVNLELSRMLLRVMEADRAGRPADVARLLQNYEQRVREIQAEQERKPENMRVIINQQAISQRALQDLLGRGSPEVLQRRAPLIQREEVGRMYERTVP